MRQLLLDEQITIFKAIAICKRVSLGLLTLIPNSVLEELKQMQIAFLWGNKWANIKHDKLCSNVTEGFLKSVDIKHEFSALKCSWIQRLYNKNPSEIYL